MITYLIEVCICWALFYSLYAALLSKETFFSTNRWYLLTTLLLGLVLPLLDVVLRLSNNHVAVQEFGVNMEEVIITARKTEQSIKNVTIDFMPFLVVIYWLGVLFFGVRFFIGIRQIANLYDKSSKIHKKGGYILVETDEAHLPFSFFNLLFWSKNLDLEDREGEIILRHELAHIQQLHSGDVFILELIQVFLWWNPFVYLYNRSLRAVHEYLADEQATRNAERKAYGKMLIEFATENPRLSLANHFIYSQLKNRLKMIMKKRSAQQVIWKYGLFVPTLLIAILICANPQVIDAQVIAPSSSKPLQENTSIRTVTYKDKNGKTVTRQDTIIVNKINPTKKSEKDESVYTVVEQQPEFKGGQSALFKYLGENIKYPGKAKEDNIVGRVVVKFIVTKEGNIDSPQILRGIGAGCDEETIRVIKTMSGMWTAGKQDGKPVDVYFTLPVQFDLGGDKVEEKKE